MITYTKLDSLELKNPTACGLGNFDGVHLGHQKLIKEMVRQACLKNLDSCIITFEPHPSKILNPTGADPLILNLRQKEKLIYSLGVNNLILAPFTLEFSKMHYKDFIEEILIKKCRANVVVVGSNYRFGYKGEGNSEILKQLCQKKGIEAIIIPPVMYKGQIVSSTLIRSMIKAGDVKNAREYMGHFFSIEGKVVHGNSIGSTLGFPTANISFSKEIILPDYGVYAVLVKYKEQKYKAVANIGRRPTFNGSDVTLEVHIFDFNKQIYDEFIEVYFVDQIRKEIKFNSPFELKKRMEIDCEKAKNILKDFKHDFTFLGVYDKIKNRNEPLLG